MDHKTGLAMILGVICGILIVVIIFAIKGIRNKGRAKYDERQIAVQGKAYKTAFFTMLILAGLYVSIDLVGIDLPVQPSLAVFTIIVISVCVMATPMILKDAYFELHDNRKRIIIGLLFLFIGNAFPAVAKLTTDGLMENGELNFLGTSNLLCSFLMLYILVLYWIKTLIDKRED